LFHDHLLIEQVTFQDILMILYISLLQ
jgi:hypothetical protein